MECLRQSKAATRALDLLGEEIQSGVALRLPPHSKKTAVVLVGHWTLPYAILSTMPGQFEVMIERNFSSAHQLRGYKGKCENLHGHNYRIEIYARGRELDNIGLLVDFVELKAAADEVVQYLDHQNINELAPFHELQPSAENLAKYILERVGSKVGDDRVQIFKVRCFETPTSVATYQVD